MFYSHMQHEFPQGKFIQRCIFQLTFPIRYAWFTSWKAQNHKNCARTWLKWCSPPNVNISSGFQHRISSPCSNSCLKTTTEVVVRTVGGTLLQVEEQIFAPDQQLHLQARGGLVLWWLWEEIFSVFLSWLDLVDVFIILNIRTWCLLLCLIGPHEKNLKGWCRNLYLRGHLLKNVAETMESDIVNYLKRNVVWWWNWKLLLLFAAIWDYIV